MIWVQAKWRKDGGGWTGQKEGRYRDDMDLPAVTISW